MLLAPGVHPETLAGSASEAPAAARTEIERAEGLAAPGARSVCALRALFLASGVLALPDVARFVLRTPAELELGGAVLGALYAALPYVLGGLLLGGLAAVLLAVAGPEDAGPAPDRSPWPARGAWAVVIGAGAAITLLIAPLLIVAAGDRARAALWALLALPGLGWIGLRALPGLEARLDRLDERSAFFSRARPSVGAWLLGLALAIAPAPALIADGRLQLAYGDLAAGQLAAYLPLIALFYWTSRRHRPTAPARLILIAALLTLVVCAHLIWRLDAASPLAHALGERSLALGATLPGARALLDGDGDGYSALLGGGDCDDTDPEVHPGALDAPGDGRDEDCRGGDAQVSPGAHDDPVAVIEPGSADRPPNLLLVTVDTLRPDHLGAYGYGRQTSPILDALADTGLRFEWAFAQAAQTKASMPSMFTGRYFSEVERTPEQWARIHPDNLTLAERLRDAGYRTAGVPAHRYFMRGYGLDQGFESWDLSVVRRHGKDVVHTSVDGEITDAAVAWMRRAAESSEPFFLWVHYFDPHHFYQDHDALVDFGDRPVDRYDEEIRSTDRHLGRLLEALRASPAAKRTFVLVHSDHGEAFGEHDLRYHGQHLYNHQVRVPLVLTGPGLVRQVVRRPVALLDVLPTLLELAGIEADETLPGVSLLATAGGAPRPPVFMEMLKDLNHSERRAIVDWPLKLQYGLERDRITLFDLETDPGEQHDLAAARPADARRLKKALETWRRHELRPAKPSF